MLTDEPNGKLCPMRFDAASGSSMPCCGRLCMAWRWAQPSATLGFCGLAGIPLFFAIEAVTEAIQAKEAAA
jgi:hypothetical protein